MSSSQDIWKLWHTFRESKQHTNLPPASLIAEKQSTALFTVAGMQPLIPYLSWQEHLLGKRLYNIQPCIRTNDLDEVGDDSHHTMFFMMGNRSLGDYFKKESIWRSWEFLTTYLKLDPRKLAVTAYEGDDIVAADMETVELWKQQWVPNHKISLLTADDNRRSPGPVWPCGPCTEIYYWIGETEFPWPDDNIKADENKWLEIWNNVFMEFYRDESGTLSKLDKQNVDTGMGFERICKVLQGVQSPYETDFFAPILHIIQEYTNKLYADHKRSMRIIADHMRASTFLIAEWLIPSNEGRWYVLRRIVRRTYFQLYQLSWDAVSFAMMMDTVQHIIDSIIIHYKDRFSFLDNKNNTVRVVIEKELKQFAKTLSQWEKILDKCMNELWSDTVLTGEKIFMLYDTFGFPVELTQEIAQKRNIILDTEWFVQTMEEAKEKSRANTTKLNTKDIDRSLHLVGITPTKFVWYDHYDLDDMKLLKKLDFDDYSVVIFDRTPCYATMGWQLHDIGIWTDDDGQEYQIFDVQQYNGVFLHFIR